MSSIQLPLSRRSFLAGAAATGIIALHPFSARAQANQAHLRIMETTDIHVNVLPYDYYADKPNDTMGLARTATLIDAVRKEATNAMLVDNGDFLQGNPMGDYIAYEKGMKDGDIHPVIKGMNLLGYQCSTLGNHEFNYGLSFMDKVLAGAKYPFVCANLVKGTELAANPRDDKLYLKPYIILEKKIKDGAGAELPIKIGIIGLLLAVVATALNAFSQVTTQLQSIGMLAGAVAVGATIGAVVAARVAMTNMPELVAILHSFVGAAAVHHQVLGEQTVVYFDGVAAHAEIGRAHV